jgi:hypothetical protein
MDLFSNDSKSTLSNSNDEKFNKVINTLQSLTEEVKTIKDNLKSSGTENMSPMAAESMSPMAAESMSPMAAESMSPMTTESMSPALPPMAEGLTSNNALQTNKNKKYYDGLRGRVSLSLPRIIMLIKNNIGKNQNKNWSEIVEKLNNATTEDQVQNIINTDKLSFSANSIGGTRKKRRGGKRRRTSKRY